jgi:Flp pilus assembly protein TadD
VIEPREGVADPAEALAGDGAPGRAATGNGDRATDGHRRRNPAQRNVAGAARPDREPGRVAKHDQIARRQGRIGFRVETASLLGYALTRLERYEEAVEVLTEAEALADGDVTPVRQRHVWELLAVATDGAGNAAAADRWLGRLAVA